MEEKPEPQDQPQPEQIIKTTLFPEATRKAVQALLEPHGASLEAFDHAERPSCLIHFPEGTTKELTERLAYHERYTFTFPDGFEIFQSVDAEGWSTIRFLADEVGK